jgi:hypothetical protein
MAGTNRASLVLIAWRCVRTPAEAVVDDHHIPSLWINIVLRFECFAELERRVANRNTGRRSEDPELKLPTPLGVDFQNRHHLQPHLGTASRFRIRPGLSTSKLRSLRNASAASHVESFERQELPWQQRQIVTTRLQDEVREYVAQVLFGNEAFRRDDHAICCRAGNDVAGCTTAENLPARPKSMA